MAPGERIKSQEFQLIRVFGTHWLKMPRGVGILVACEMLDEWAHPLS